jgi:hypothetical protein
MDEFGSFSAARSRLCDVIRVRVMPRLTTVRVMISSRSKQRFSYGGTVNAQLSDIRKKLAEIIEKEDLFVCNRGASGSSARLS